MDEDAAERERPASGAEPTGPADAAGEVGPADETGNGVEPDEPAERFVRRPSRGALAALGVPLVALLVAGYVGDALQPTLVDSHPAWLIALNPRNRNLVLTTNQLDAWTYYGVGTVRLLLTDPAFFLLGYWYGDAAVRWMERRTRTWGEMLRQVERWFGKAAYPLIFVAPNNYICLFAGAAGMPLAAFFAVNVTGTVVRLYLVRRFGEAFESPIQDVVDWIGDNRGPLLVVTVTLVVVSIALEAKRGETEVSSLAHLDDELDAAAHEDDGVDAPDRRQDGAGASTEDPASADPAEAETDTDTRALDEGS
jgi:membrane protein DedA with SNARE-associated domain